MREDAIRLTPRLQRVADCVPQGARLADVGTDHAYLPAALLLSGRIERAVASDIHEGPLERARQTLRACGLTERVALRLCAGLDAIAPEEADTVVIAGMGGETMIEILAAAPWACDGAHRLILQPMTKLPELRAWLGAHGCAPRAEHLALERGTYYVVMEAAGGAAQTLSAADCFAGAAFGADPLYGAYLDELQGKLAHVRAGLEQMQREDNRARLAEVCALSRALADKRKEWEHAKGI